MPSSHRRPLRQPARHVRRGGLTLAELLVTLAVLGIVAGIGAMLFIPMWRRHQGESFVQTLVQNINTSRSRTMSTGTPNRVVLLTESAYRVDTRAGTTWAAGAPVVSANVRLGGFTSGDYLQFDTKGFVTSHTSGGVTRSTPISSITATFAGKTRTVRVTLIGLAREF